MSLAGPEVSQGRRAKRSGSATMLVCPFLTLFGDGRGDQHGRPDWSLGYPTRAAVLAVAREQEDQESIFYS